MPFQIPHCENIISTIYSLGSCLDASDTGTGKTYTTCAVIKALNKIPIIVAPKNILSTWRDVLSYFEIKEYYLSNIEQYKTGKFPFFVKNEYMKKRKKIIDFTCSLDDKNIFIVDETHCIKNYESQNTTLAKSVIDKCYTLYLSATMTENPSDLYCVGKSLRLFENYSIFIFNHGCYTDRYGLRYNGAFNKELNDMIFNAKIRFQDVKKRHYRVYRMQYYY